MNVRALVTTIVAKFGVTSLNAISIIFLAQVYGSVGVGIFSLLRTVPLIFNVISDFGFSHSYSFLINVKKYKKYDVFSTQLTMWLLISLFQCFLWIGISSMFTKLFQFPLKLEDYFVLCLVAPSISFQMHLIGYYRAVDDIKNANVIAIVTEFLITTSVVILIFMELPEDIIVYTVAIPLLITSFLMMTHAYCSKKFTFCLPDMEIIKAAFNFGIKSQLGNTFQILNYRLDQLVLGLFLGASSVGLYVVAVKVVEVFKVFSLSIVFVFEPELSKLSQSSALNYVRVNYFKVLILNAVVVIFGVLLMPMLIPIFFDTWSADAILSFYILSVGIFFAGGNGFISAYFLGHGKPIITTYSTIITLVVTVTLNFLLVPIWGVEGAAVASSSGYIAISIFLFFFMRKEVNHNLKLGVVCND